MDLVSFILVFLVALVIFQFWRFRAVAEKIVQFSHQYCEKHDLQYISLARTHTTFKAYKGKLDWQLSYELAFSSDGEIEYKGTITCHGKHILSVDLPAHRVSSLH